MTKKLILIILILLLWSLPAFASDLYKVTINTQDDINNLKSIPIDPLVRLDDGYLVLGSKSDLEASSLEFELIYSNISRVEIALDGRMDNYNSDKQILFEKDNIRLFRVDYDLIRDFNETSQLFPLGKAPKLELTRKVILDNSKRVMLEDLNTLIANIEQDSLQSYLERLQAFYRRTAGSDSNYVSRDWLENKFISFGYDSVIIDSFVANLSGVDSDCQNVLAIKQGTLYPNHYIVVGAHRDAVSTSPGADDNGSGTVGVLEIARILKDVETELTIVFALFDAEEFGLYGAWHFVEEADSRGDSIMYMLNLDMIGHYENSTDANLFHGTDLTFSNLWQDLGDSLLGLTGYLAGASAGSDHYPFTQYNIPATFVAERIFSNVYHTYQDSTSYIDFNYMTKLVKASAATIYMASSLATPQPALLLAYISELPAIVPPEINATIEISVVDGWGGEIVPGSEYLHYSYDGSSYNSLLMIETSPGLYTAEIPGVSCFTDIYYYVSLDEVTSGTFYLPDPAYPKHSYTATGSSLVFEDNFETNKGWSVTGNATDGQWNRGLPIGGGVRGDPEVDYDKSGQCYLTDNVEGNSDVDGGTTILTSPVIDVSDGDALIKYARWFSNDFGGSPYEDTLSVQISNNGGLNYVVAERIGPAGLEVSGGWYEHWFWISEFVIPTDQIRIRITAGDLGAGSVVEAGLDDFSITRFSCVPAYICGDMNNDGQLPGISDLTYFVDYMFNNGPAPPVTDAADINADGSLSISDLTYLVAYLFSSGAPPVCQ